MVCLAHRGHRGLMPSITGVVTSETSRLPLCSGQRMWFCGRLIGFSHPACISLQWTRKDSFLCLFSPSVIQVVLLLPHQICVLHFACRNLSQKMRDMPVCFTLQCVTPIAEVLSEHVAFSDGVTRDRVNMRPGRDQLQTRMLISSVLQELYCGQKDTSHGYKPLFVFQRPCQQLKSLRRVPRTSCSAE